MAKKYITGQEPVFDEAFIRYKNESQILRKSDSVFAPTMDKRGLQSLLVELEGDQKGSETNGKYFDINKNRWVVASIPAIKIKLAELEADFETYKQTRINEGWHAPKEMTVDKKKEYLQLEARLNVKERELDKIKTLLKEIDNREKAERRSELFQYGAEGSGNLSGGIITNIDGQKVSVINRWPTIDDDCSPFDGMRVCDYREFVSQPWHSKKEKIQRQAAQYVSDCRAKGMTIDERKASPPPPAVDRTWPSGVRNWKKG